MKGRIFLFLFSVLIYTASSAQSACPDCVVDLPALPGDTLYLAPAPAGRVGEAYSADISFRIPRTTTPVAAVDSTVPPGITINRITINTLTNVPPGLSWEINNTIFNLPDETDGCIHFCGTPLVPGLYLVEVVITARVFIIDETTSFSFPLLVEPAQRITEGFTMTNNVGCGAIDVRFANNVPSGGREGFSYRWDFGNGNTSFQEQPVAQRYETPGVFPVHYEAIVDTAGYVLTNVRVDKVSCSDLLGNAPDLQVKVYDPEGKEIFASDVRDNKRPPLDFNLTLPIGPGNYLVEVLDDDDGIFGGDKVCGTFNFNQNTEGSLADNQAGVTLTILHPVDTVSSVDTVIVYPQPESPAVTFLAVNPLCAGDTVLLESSYAAAIQWYRDSVPLIGADFPTLTVTQPGDYWVTYTSPDGCRAASRTVPVDFAERPTAPVLFLDKNLLYLAETPPLPDNVQLTWELDGAQLPEEGSRQICVGQSGRYTVVLTDRVTGCSQRRSLAVTYNPAYPGCVSAVDAFADHVQEVRLFPNPSAGLVTLELSAREAQPLDWVLWNAQGQRLRTGMLRLIPGTTSFAMDFSDLPAGMYTLQLRVKEGQRSLRLVLM